MFGTCSYVLAQDLSTLVTHECDVAYCYYGEWKPAVGPPTTTLTSLTCGVVPCAFNDLILVRHSMLLDGDSRVTSITGCACCGEEECLILLHCTGHEGCKVGGVVPIGTTCVVTPSNPSYTCQEFKCETGGAGRGNGAMWNTIEQCKHALHNQQISQQNLCLRTDGNGVRVADRVTCRYQGLHSHCLSAARHLTQLTLRRLQLRRPGSLGNYRRRGKNVANLCRC